MPERQAGGGTPETIDVRPDERAPGVAVGSQPAGGLVDRSLEEDQVPLRQGMRERSVRLDPLEPVLRERQRAKERGRGGQGMDPRADVVTEPGPGELGRLETAPRLRLSLVDPHPVSGPGQHEGGRQPVRARSRDDHVGAGLPVPVPLGDDHAAHGGRV